MQEYRLLREPVWILPGDDLIVECIYDSTERAGPTLGGYSTKEEMCLAFLLYSPPLWPSPFCVSHPTAVPTLTGAP